MNFNIKTILQKDVKDLLEFQRKNDREPGNREKDIYKQLSEKIAQFYGINIKDVNVSLQQQFQDGAEKAVYKMMLGIKREAAVIRFSLEGTNEELKQEAIRLIEDYDNFTKTVRNTGKTDIPNYSGRREAKELLFASLARKLKSCLDESTFEEIMKKAEKVNLRTPGVGIASAQYWSNKEEGQKGRCPEMGAFSKWKTPGGLVEGKIIGARTGGPYVIQTSKGTIQVDDII